MKEYRKRSHVVDKIKEYNEKPEVKKRRKEYLHEYYRRPEVMQKERSRMRERRKDLSFVESQKEYKKLYESRPEVRERISKYRRKYMKEYTKRPSVIQKKRNYESKIRGACSDVYMKQLLYSQAKGLLIMSEIPMRLITLKRRSLKLKRLIKSKGDE